MTTPRWYMVNKMGMATLCTDRADAEKEAADAQSAWPHMGPHRAVRLVEASFEAADMATAADGFRDGAACAAAELRRLHAYCQELEAQVILECMTHVQNPAENEHVAGDVSKNGAELNLSAQQPAPDCHHRPSCDECAALAAQGGSK